MLKIKIIAIGKLKESAYRELEKEFLKRLSPFSKIRITELPEIAYKQNQDLEKVKEKEAEILLKHFSKDAVTILLEESGEKRDSVQFANFLERIGGFGREIIFVVGSGIGLHKSLKGYANYTISLSPLTFPHNMARIILEEQIYRACTILSGKNYHK